MKRSQSATPESTPAKKKPNIASTASDDEPSSGAERKPDKASKTKAASSAPPGEWTPEKREIFMDRLIDCGYRSLDLGALAHEVSRVGSMGLEHC